MHTLTRKTSATFLSQCLSATVVHALGPSIGLAVFYYFRRGSVKCLVDVHITKNLGRVTQDVGRVGSGQNIEPMSISAIRP